MANLTLMAQNGAATVGPAFFIGTAVTTVNIECSPQPSAGFGGTVIIDGSTVPNPGSSDWFAIATMVFSAHTSVLDFNLYFTNNPWIRCRVPANASQGAIAVYLAY
jgi:hypothetical protein